MIENTGLTSESYVAIAIGLYGIYTIITALLILFNRQKILDPAKYIRIGIIKLSGNEEKAISYEQKLKEEKNWPLYGVYVFVFGVGCIVGAFIIWSI